MFSAVCASENDLRLRIHGSEGREILATKFKRQIMRFILIIFTVVVPVTGLCQSYSVDWHEIAGGGGVSTGSVYSVSGTIGQSDAGSVMTGGNYAVTGGFWALYAIQTPGAPLLSITRIGNQAVVSWNQSVTGWVLQTNVNLATPTWGNYVGPVVDNGITNAPPRGNLFFRLKE